jgi:hypothetical protein
MRATPCLLIPFIVDPFGVLSTIANCFLFGLCPDPAPNPLHFHSTTSQEAYNNTMSLATPTSLSHRADQYWSCNSPHLPFGNTYHSWFPTNWIWQTLDLVPTSIWHLHNICTAASTKTIHPNYDKRSPTHTQTQSDTPLWILLWIRRCRWPRCSCACNMPIPIPRTQLIAMTHPVHIYF